MSSVTTRATIHDVAAQARVSIKTVSRVINNVKTVKPHTRERVMRVIRKLDYHPNPSARGLGGNRSSLIGLLYDYSCDFYATSVLAGVIETCRAAHYQVVMHPCDYQSPKLVAEIGRSVHQSRAAGMIITPPLSDLTAVTDFFEQEGIPFVRIAPAERSDVRRSVFTNDRESCARMTEQLVAMGHRRIAFLMGHPDHIAIADRYRGFCDGLKGCGLALDKKLVLQGDNSYLCGVRTARKLLQLPELKRPTAIFAANDEMAAGVLAVAHEMGLSVPEEVSVAGFDDMPLASKVWPALTTIRQPIPAMAARAAELLMMQLRGEPDDQSEHVLESSLTFRQSTGPAPNRMRATAERAKLQRRAKAVSSAA